MEADHVRPLHLGGDPWSLHNLQTLCSTCHVTKTRTENRRPDTPVQSGWRRMVLELTEN